MLARLLRLTVLPVLLLLAPAYPAGAADALTPAQKAEVEKVIHDYLMDHPDFMVEVLRAAEAHFKAQKAANGKQTIASKRDELLHDAGTAVGGNPDGDVTIVEFFDYRCPYCKQVEPALEAMAKDDPKLRIVYKEYPVLGADSMFATKMALAARMQGKYAAFHDAMMATKGQIGEQVILDVAKAAGVDVARAKADMESSGVQEIIKRNYALAESLDIQGTPAFIIGDTLVPGAADIDSLKKLVAEARHAG